MPDRETRHPDFDGLRLAEQPVMPGALIARNVDTYKFGLLSKRPGIRRMNHRQYAGQILCIDDLQRVCDYGKFLVISGLGAAGEVFEHQQTWPDPTPPGGSGAGPWGGGGGGGVGGGDPPPEPPFDPNWPPMLKMSADTNEGCVPLTVQFSSVGSWDPDGGIASYWWDFGDGGTSTDPNPSHTFATDGVFNVRLTITDDQGETDMGILPVTVNPPSMTWRTIYANPPFNAARTPAFVYNPDDDEFAVVYGKAGDANLYMQIISGEDVVILPETVVANNLYSPGGGLINLSIAWDGAQYGVLYRGSFPYHPQFLRVNRAGVATVGPIVIEAVVPAGLYSSYAISWNGSNFLAVYQGPVGAPLLCRYALINTAGNNVFGPAVLTNANVTCHVAIASDGAGWLVNYWNNTLGQEEVRYISGAGALGGTANFTGLAALSRHVAWNAGRFGVAGRDAGNDALRFFNAVPALIGTVSFGATVINSVCRNGDGWAFARRGGLGTTRILRLDIAGAQGAAEFDTGEGITSALFASGGEFRVGILGTVAVTLATRLGIGTCMGV